MILANKIRSSSKKKFEFSSLFPDEKGGDGGQHPPCPLGRPPGDQFILMDFWDMKQFTLMPCRLKMVKIWTYSYRAPGFRGAKIIFI